MPHGILEIAPEAETQRSTAMSPRVFADQYAAILAEHSIQDYARQVERRRRDLSKWFALAIASGVLIAAAFVYFLGS
jgi:hypothetical protein